MLPSNADTHQIQDEEAVAICRELDGPLRLAHTVRHLGDIHVVEDIAACFVARSVDPPLYTLAFQQLEEALSDGVVEAVTAATPSISGGGPTSTDFAQARHSDRAVKPTAVRRTAIPRS